MPARLLKNDLLLRAARGERTARTPVWMMRQAGRYDPEYQALRNSVDLPLERLFCTPDLAAQISLLPRRIGVDAIIFYQDILTPLAPLGASFVFRPGPQLADPIRTTGDVERLRSYDPADELAFVPETLRLVREALGGELPLLGFAGAPITLAFFMIEGGSPGADPWRARRFLEQAPRAAHRLLELLAEMTTDYLALQIEAGVDAIQLFESVGDLLTESQYREFAHPYHQRIFERLGDRVPRILFVKERPWVDLMAASGADVLSLGACVDLAEARRRVGSQLALQGNVDNRILVDGPPDRIDEAVRRCIAAGQHTGHILNLNHGILRQTPFENACRFIEAAKRTVIEPQSPPSPEVV